MSRSRAPFTHAVWWRYHSIRVGPTAWHDVPRLYRSEASAVRAVHDLNAYHNKLAKSYGVFTDFIAYPLGIDPNSIRN